MRSGSLDDPDAVYDVTEEFVLKEKPETFEQMTLHISREISKILAQKQRDYGRGNIDAFGELGVLVRASDKLERLKNLLMKDAKPSNESLEDTWLDWIGYGFIGLAVHRGWWCPPFEEDQ